MNVGEDQFYPSHFLLTLNLDHTRHSVEPPSDPDHLNLGPVLMALGDVPERHQRLEDLFVLNTPHLAGVVDPDLIEACSVPSSDSRVHLRLAVLKCQQGAIAQHQFVLSVAFVVFWRQFQLFSRILGHREVRVHQGQKGGVLGDSFELGCLVELDL